VFLARHACFVELFLYLRTISSFRSTLFFRSLTAVALSKEQIKLLASFGANVRRLRSAAGVTQSKLAEKVDLELRTIQKFEAGQINVPLTTLYRVRRALNCSWESLLGK
jgi:DNA-binding XRE family transcriptional regulator